MARSNKKSIAIIGYGSQGRAMALNLRDSGWEVHVGLRQSSKSRRIAKADGIASVHTIPVAVEKCDIIALAIPDHVHGQVFRGEVEPSLLERDTKCLLVLHGMSVHFGLIEPPDNCDVVLLASHAPGVAVREKYLGDRSVSAFFAVHQDASGHARRTVIQIARDLGIDRTRLIETTFAHEAVGDLFGEQAVLCGGLAMLIKSGFDTLVANGLPAENAYLEVAFQLDLIVDLIRNYGIGGMFDRISVAARYGSAEAGPRLIDAGTRQRMQRIYERIDSGAFARDLSGISDGDIRGLKKALRALSSPALERVAKKHAPQRKK